MDTIFSQTQYTLKRQGLAIGGKYQLFGAQDDKPLLYIEEKSKWIPPSQAFHVYADEKKTREVLTLKTSESDSVEMDIIDAESGQKIGGIGVTADDLAEVVKDSWEITDADDKRLAKMFEKSAARSVMREMLDDALPQQLDITVGESLVGELRQKVKMIGYVLNIDFSMDSAHILDRRLGLAAVIYAAYHQGSGLD